MKMMNLVFKMMNLSYINPQSSKSSSLDMMAQARILHPKPQQCTVFYAQFRSNLPCFTPNVAAIYRVLRTILECLPCFMPKTAPISVFYAQFRSIYRDLGLTLHGMIVRLLRQPKGHLQAARAHRMALGCSTGALSRFSTVFRLILRVILINQAPARITDLHSDLC